MLVHIGDMIAGDDIHASRSLAMGATCGAHQDAPDRRHCRVASGRRVPTGPAMVAVDIHRDGDPGDRTVLQAGHAARRSR